MTLIILYRVSLINYMFNDKLRRYKHISIIYNELVMFNRNHSILINMVKILQYNMY
jgi:hypothetical protein